MEEKVSNRIQSAAQLPNSTLKRAPVSDDIQVRAYQIYVSRNREPGHELDDWLQAERELLPRN
jgi:Protein of unknown function (DUF2934)